MKQSRRWLAVVLLAASTTGLAQNPVILVPGTESVPLAGHIEVLRDDTNQLTFEQVRSPPVATRFVPSHDDSSGPDWAEPAHWYRMELRADTGGDSDWVVEVKNALLDELALYIVRADGTVQSFLSGDRRKTAPGQIAHRRFAFPVRAAQGASLTLYIRARTAGRHFVPLQLWSASAFQAKVVGENLAWGARFGVLWLMALFHLLVFLWVRDRAYLYYSFALFAFGCFGPIDAGYARLYGNDLFEIAPTWINWSYPVFLGLMTIFTWLFIGEFLQLRQISPVLQRVRNAMVAVGVAQILLLPWLGYTMAAQFNNPLSWASWMLALAIALYLAVQGHRMARFFLLAWGLAIAGQIAWLATFNGWLPMNAFTLFAPGAGLVLGLALFSLAIADRISGERKERFAAEEGMRRMKTYLPQQVAELVGAGDNALLAPKRRSVTVCVIDLRGFTPFSETTAPEDVMSVLREFYDTMGKVVEQHGGTVEHFAGDSMLIFFNAPLEIEKHEEYAVRAALEMRAAFEPLRGKWIKLGHELGLGIGIADGYATIGAIGFAGRSQYAAIGAVTNLAARLCSEAKHGEILTTSRVLHAIEAMVNTEPGGEQAIRGFSKPISVVRVLQLKAMPGAA